MKNIKGFIFDLDGTLIDSRKDLVTSVNLTRKNYNLEKLDFQTVVSFIGNGTRKLVERSFEKTKVDIDAAFSIYKNYYSQHLADETFCYPGVKELLEKTKNLSIKTAVVTNKHEEATQKILKFLKIDHYFDIILGADSLDFHKPSPEPLLYVAKKWKLKPEELIMVGDHWTDMAAARNAGIKSVYVNFGFGDFRDEKPDFFADKPEEILELIEKF
jgi:phosphoglycolate phosphatase